VRPKERRVDLRVDLVGVGHGRHRVAPADDMINDVPLSEAPVGEHEHLVDMCREFRPELVGVFSVVGRLEILMDRLALVGTLVAAGTGRSGLYGAYRRAIQSIRSSRARQCCSLPELTGRGELKSVQAKGLPRRPARRFRQLSRASDLQPHAISSTTGPMRICSRR